MGNNPERNNELIKGYISPIRQGRRKPPMSAEQKPPITPHENDILMGRGGKNNQHSGNNQLRALARRECRNYRVSSKKGKSYISRELVKRVREMDPPGRFLKKNNNTGLWEDVGDDVAREKASQALRDAVAIEFSQEDDEHEEEEPQEEHVAAAAAAVEPVPSSHAFRRTVSAPPIMDKSPNDGRRKTWPVQERRQPPRPESTPHYPPVTPASRTSAPKRRRFYEEANSPWMYQPEQPPYGSPDFTESRSNPEFSTQRHHAAADYTPSSSRSYPTQQARRSDYYPQYQQQPQHHYAQHPGAPTYYAGGQPPPPPEDEFDLFNGQLLEPPAGEQHDETSLERRSDTF